MRALNVGIIPLEDKTSFIFDIRVPIDSPREVADQIFQNRIKKLASHCNMNQNPISSLIQVFL